MNKFNKTPKRRENRGKSVKTASLLVLTVVFTLILCGAASAADNNVALNTTHNGAVSGDLYVNATQPVAFADQPTDVTSREFNQTFDLPTNSSAGGSDIEWAQVYVNIYSGSGSNNWPLNATILLDGDGDGVYETTLGTELLTSENYSTDGTQYWINDHCFRVYSDYQLWYDVTGLITCTNPSIYVKTEQVSTDPFDGRLKMIALVAAYNDGDDDLVDYWVNSGQDWINSGSTSSTTFNTSTLTATADNATLNTVVLSSKDGTYDFNGETHNGTDPVAPINYFITHTWDVTATVTTGNDSTLNFTAGSGSFKAVLATLTIRESTLPVADFTATPTSGNASLTVNFTDNSTGATEWLWDFGDGTTSTNQNPTHTYSTLGSYTVTLTATNNAGSNTTTKTGYITVTSATGIDWTRNSTWDVSNVAGYRVTSTSTDLDGDGDYDLLIGAQDGVTYGYENTGTTSSPVWTQKSEWNISDVGSYATPCLADLDGDGDYDLLIGSSAGVIYAYKNTGTVTNPIWTANSAWDVPDVISYASPAFADLDGDGDYDLLIGEYGGICYAYENTGSASSPVWTAKSEWNTTDIGSRAHPAFADLDGDGDYDLLIGESGGVTYGYENTGTTSSPVWTAKSEWNTSDVGDYASPYCADLDGDGDYDLLIGAKDGYCYAYENTGTTSSPLWTAKSEWNNGFLKYYATPCCADLDGDGDYDLLIGTAEGVCYGYENTGTTSSPVYTRKSEWDTPDVGDYAVPTLVDLDGDGDYDLLIGEYYGVCYAYENTGTTSSPVWTVKSEWDTPDVGDFARPCIADLDGDGDYDLLIGEKWGVCYGYANTGSTSSPVWTAKSEWNAPDIGSYVTPGLADLDDDGDYDLLIGEKGGYTYGYENTGSISSPVWTSNSLFARNIGYFNMHARPCFADLDGDGDYDILLGVANGISAIYAYENGGCSAADLTPTAVNPVDLTVGTLWTITATVDNTGTFNVGAFVATLSVDGVVVDTQSVLGPNAGSSSTVNFSWTPTTAGSYTLTVTVDPIGGIEESDETNNVLTVPLTVVVDNQAPTVTATPSGGNLANITRVALSATDDYDTDPIIYYTLDGTDPTTSSTVYIDPITIAVTTTLKFIAADDTGNISAVQSETYTDSEAPTTSADPVGGNLTSAVQVILSAVDNVTSDPVIYYTLDGTDPTTSSTVYTDPVNIASTTTLKFIAVDASGNISAVQSETYTIDDTEAPTIAATPAGEIYTSRTEVALSAQDNVDPNPVIYYTLDGTDPTTNSTLYTDPLTIETTTTLKFIAVDASGNISAVQSETYTIDDTEAPVVTASQSGTTVTLSATDNADSNPTIYYTTDGSDPTTSSTPYSGPFTIPQYASTVVKFIAVDVSGNVSTVDSKTFTTYTGDPWTGGRYYNGTDMETGYYAEGNIGMVISNGGTGYTWFAHNTPGTGTVTYTAGDLNIPEGATILEARLYQAWTWYGYPNYTLTFNGYTVTPTAHYVDSDDGQDVFDVTEYFNATGDNTAVLTATGGASYATILIVVYQLDSEPYRQIWINEGYDVLYHSPATGYAVFDDVDTDKLVSAEIITITPSGGGDTGSILFNEQTITINGSGGSDPNYSYYDVSSTLQNGTNEVGVYGGSYLSLQNAILTLTLDTTAPTITANPTSGVYNITQTVTLTATDDYDTNPNIYYTLNGDDPTTDSTLYTDPISIDVTSTLKFIVVDYVGNVSELQTETYTIDTEAPDVSASIGTGVFGDSQNVTLTATDNVDTSPDIYYTTDGTAPTTSSLLYSDPIIIDTTTVLKFIAVDDMGNVSQVQSKTYIIDTKAPTTSADLAGGLYNSTLNVVLNAKDNIDAHPTIYYTTNGDTPTTSSTQYTEPISIDSTTTLQFIAVDLFGNVSPVQTETYTINTDTTAPTITTVDPANCTTSLNGDESFTVTFSEDIMEGTNWIELVDGSGTAIPFTTSISGNVLTITPTSDLVESAYKLMLHTSSLTDLAGNLLVGKSFRFSVGTAPTITTVDPVNGSTNISVDKSITVTFSEAIQASKNFWVELINSTGEAIPFTTTIIDNVLTITPTSDLAEDKYKLMLHTGSVTDIAGNLLAGQSFRFSVGTSPTITGTNPADGATNVHVAKTITVTFNEAIRRSSKFWVELVDSTGTAVDYTSYITSGNILVINPTSDLAANTTYKLKIHTGSVTDIAGNLLAAKVISFTTRST